MAISILPNGVTVANDALAASVTFGNGTLHCHLQDGRTISVPLSWYPRLARATSEQLAGWRLIGGGIGIHWEQVDEDLAVSDFMAGCNGPESEFSAPVMIGKVLMSFIGHAQETRQADEQFSSGQLPIRPLIAEMS